MSNLFSYFIFILSFTFRSYIMHGTLVPYFFPLEDTATDTMHAQRSKVSKPPRIWKGSCSERLRRQRNHHFADMITFILLVLHTSKTQYSSWSTSKIAQILSSRSLCLTMAGGAEETFAITMIIILKISILPFYLNLLRHLLKWLK